MLESERGLEMNAQGDTRVVPAGPGVAVETRFVADVERWLATQELPDVPIRWHGPVGGRAVSGVEMLAGLVAGLREPGSWGVADRPVTGAWAQTMRIHDGWIIEVDGGTGPDAFARRVRRTTDSAGETTGTRRRCSNPRGDPVASCFDTEVIASPAVVARLMWTWLRGRLPAGYETRPLIRGLD